MKEAEIEKSIADGLLALPGVPQAVKEKYKQKSWIWIPDKEREVVGYDSNSFFSVFAYDEVGDFVVTDNIVPWDYLRRDSLLTEMRYVWEFSQEPITFVKEPKFS
jgi:hypothetical protein